MLKVKLTKNHLFKGSFIVLLGNTVANFFNYLYHLLTGRLLAPSQYGLLQSLIALTYFLGVFVSSFSFVVINAVGQTKPDQLASQIRTLEKKALQFTLFSWLIFLLLFPLISKLLHFESFFLYLVFTLPILFSFLITLYHSTLRAQLKFTEFSLSGALGGLFKLASSVFLILTGWQIIGALIGLTIGGLTSFSLSWFWVKKGFRKLTHKKSILLKTVKSGPGFWRFSILSLITNLGLISLYSTDLLLVRYFFSALEAGLYSAVSVLGKIIFFASTMVLLVAFPLFVRFKSKAQKLRQTFWFSFLFIIIVSLAGLIGYKLFPELIIRLLYRKAYLTAVPFLFSFAIFISLVAVLNLFVQLLLALESVVAAWLAGLTAITQIFLILLYHPSLQIVINNSIIALAIGLLLASFFVKKVLYAKKL